MDEQTQHTSQDESSSPDEGTVDPGGAETVPDSGGTTEETPDTDWQAIAELIAQEQAKKQPTYETLEVKAFGKDVELRIVHEATMGEVLVAFLLLLILAKSLVRWLFRAVWGR